MLSPNQRNRLYKVIEEQKLSARDFQIEAPGEWTKITHKPTSFYFRLEPLDVKTNNGPATFLSLFYTPLRQGDIFDVKKQASLGGIESLEKSIPYFNNWLVLLKQEFLQPDLWAEMEHTPDMFAEGEGMTDEQFTPAEIKLLEARVGQVEQQVIDLDLPPDAEAAITKAIREVPEKAKRLTKKEVGEILFSTVMREGLKAALSKENMFAVWHLLTHLFTLALHS